MTYGNTSFSKYDDHGAYHWYECERTSWRYNPPLEARYQAVVKRIADARHVLDVGCGDGYLMSLVSPRCRKITGIDAEFTGVSLAASMLRQFPNCTAATGSCYNLPFSGAYFDVVLLTDVIEHLENPRACLQEIARVMDSKGVLFVTTPKRQPHRPLGWGHVMEYTPGEFMECLGLHFAQVSTVFFCPSTWFSFYKTHVGWRFIKLFARHCYNPFLQEGSNSENYDQMLAICSSPRCG